MVGALAVAAVLAWIGYAYVDDRPRSQAAQVERRQFAKAHADPSAVLFLTSSRWGSWLLAIVSWEASVAVIVAGYALAFQ